MHPVVVLFDDASKRNCVRLPYVCARTRKFGENQKNSNSGGESSVMKRFTYHPCPGVEVPYVPLRVGMILSEGAGGCKVPQDLHCVPFSISMRTGPSARYIRSISRGSSITYVVLRRDTHLVGARALRAWKIFWYQGIGVLVYHCLYVKVPAHIRKRNNNTTSTIVGAPESTPCPTLTTHPASLKAS